LDLVTHGLLGAAVARATTTRGSRLSTRERLLVGAGAAMLPDLDFIGFLVDPLAFLADWHQGPTHSLVLLPLWAGVVTALHALYLRQTPPASRTGKLGEAYRVACLGLASHIAADLLTPYGTAILAPVSAWRPSLGTTFVIDPGFTAIVALTLALSLRAGRPRIAAAGVAVLCLYVAGQAALREQALEVARASLQAGGLAHKRLTALPQPFSPFNWKVVASGADRHHVGHMNLLGHPPLVPALPGLGAWREMAAAYVAPSAMSWQPRPRWGTEATDRALARPLWQDERLAPFRRFAVLPALSRIVRRGGTTCVWFTELRYDLPTWPDTFRYGFCRDSDGSNGEWALYRLKYLSEDRQRLSP
jgi:inner membrane protein